MRPAAWWLVLVLILGSCSGSSPRQSAEGYLGALAKMDFAGASGYVADEGRANFEFLRRLYAGLSPEEQKKFQVADWAITGESVQGDAATVNFTFDKVKQGQLTLKRVAGTWKVDHRKTF